jgi:hypothetical protein
MPADLIVAEGQHALVVNEPDAKRAMALMDRQDLEQAMAEIRGEVLEQFVYVVKGGKKQLSYAGIKEAARLYRNVHFGATATPLPDGSWLITSYAHNLADNTRVDYPLPYPAFDPSNVEESIAYRANLSKSIRNALAAVLPVTYLNTMITRWMEQRGGSGRPQGGTGQGSNVRSLPARQQQATAAQLDELRAEVSRKLANDPKAREILPKGPEHMNEAELVKTNAWLDRRAAAAEHEQAEAAAQAQQAAEIGEAIDPKSPALLERAIADARALVADITANAAKGRPGAGDYDRMRAALIDIQGLDGWEGDKDPNTIAKDEILPYLKARLAGYEEEAALGTMESTEGDGDEQHPF